MRVPTEAEEQRAHKRQRQQLREQRLSLAAQGRSLMLLQGRRQHRWETLEPTLSAWLVERLRVFRELILKVDQVVQELTRELQTQAPKVLPKGMGRPAANRTTAPPADPPRVDSVPSWWHPIPGLQNGARETGLGPLAARFPSLQGGRLTSSPGSQSMPRFKPKSIQQKR